MNKKLPQVSIVVPIFNVEKYLPECINSLRKQTLKNIEIILIDDGSSDNSGKIADEFSKKDSRIIVIHQRNSGYSKTINRGIKLARGKYIGIIESDDWIESNMYEVLFSIAKNTNSDITKGGFWKHNSFAKQQDEYFSCPSNIDLRLAPQNSFRIEDWPQIIAFHSSIWSSLYKASFLKTKNIPESSGASYQDLPFMLELMTSANTISVTGAPFVHWRNEPNQNHSTNKKDEKLLLMLKNSQTGIDIVKKSGKYNSLKEALFIHIFWANLPFMYAIKKESRKKYFQGFRKLMLPIKHDSDFNFTFFRLQDKLFVKLLISYPWFLMKIILSCLFLFKHIKNLTHTKQS